MDCVLADELSLAFSAEFSPSERRETLLTSAGPVTIHRPIGAASKGDVILLPGWSGPRTGPADALVFIASKLADHGWTSIRLDLPGRGDAQASGPIDLDAMIDAAAGCASTSVSSGRRVLLGICSGGNVALGAAPLKSCAAFDTVVAISTFPFQPARTQQFDQLRRWKNFKRYAGKALAPSTWLRLIKGEINVDRVKKNVAATEKPVEGRNLKDSARDIENELREWKGSALFIWGGGDDEARPARTHYELLHSNGMGKPKRVEFHTVSGANHNFYGKAWREEMVTEILRFLAI